MYQVLDFWQVLIHEKEKVNPYIHSLADVGSKCIGTNTRIWQYAVVFPSAAIGAECNICAHTLIENDVIIGDRVTVKSGVQLWDGLRVEDDVFIGPNVTFTNDPFPRSKQYPSSFPLTIVKTGASIGGGGNYLARVNDWPLCHGWCRVRGDQVGARWCRGAWKSGAHRSVCGGTA